MGIEACNLFRITVEGQRIVPAAAEKAAFADPVLRRLAPARMVDGRVHVGIEAVFVRGRQFQVVGGCLPVSVILTIDLIP